MLTDIAYGVGVALRAGATPLLMGMRWATSGEQGARAGIPDARLNWRLAPKIALDEFFLATEFASATIISLRDRKTLIDEAVAAVGLYRDRGWLTDPTSFHVTPPEASPTSIASVYHPLARHQHLRFESAYEPHDGEPGRERWLARAPNRTAHVRLLEHPGAERPWIVCVPGYRMGSATVDFAGFGVRHLHHGLGLNVAIPVMPLHGPRSDGRRGGDGFLAGDFVDTVHAQSQAVSDVRQLIRWLRHSRGAPSIAVYGVSLGGYTTAILAGLEAELDCVVAGIPATDFVRMIRHHLPRPLLRAAEWAGFPFDEIEDLLRVVSPLSIPPKVPKKRRFLFAGIADRLASPDQARDLWHHWERPTLRWYEGSHVSFLWEREVRELLEHAFQETGITHA